MKRIGIVFLCIAAFSCTTNSGAKIESGDNTVNPFPVSQDEEEILNWVDSYYSYKDLTYPSVFDLKPLENVEWSIHDPELVLEENETGFIITNTADGGSGFNLLGDYQPLGNFMYMAELSFLESEDPSTVRFVFNEAEGQVPNAFSITHDGTIILHQGDNEVYSGKVEGITNNEKILLLLISVNDYICVFVNEKPVCLVQNPGGNWSSGHYHWRITNHTKVLYSFITAWEIIENVPELSDSGRSPYEAALKKKGEAVENNEPVFYDDFTDNRHNWGFIAGSPDGKDLLFENGSMFLSAGGENGFMQRISPGAPPAVKDFICEINMSIIEGKNEAERQWNFFCRRGPESTHDRYRICFDFGNGTSSIFVKEEDRQPWQPEWENVKITIFVIGNRISILQNGFLVYDYTDFDSKENSGEWFLGCSSGTPGYTELAFHDIKIIEL